MSQAGSTRQVMNWERSQRRGEEPPTSCSFCVRSKVSKQSVVKTNFHERLTRPFPRKNQTFFKIYILWVFLFLHYFLAIFGHFVAYSRPLGGWPNARSTSASRKASSSSPSALWLPRGGHWLLTEEVRGGLSLVWFCRFFDVFFFLILVFRDQGDCMRFPS